MTIRINPRIDLCFKKLFGSSENKDILIDFINSVISEADQVVDITLLNPYNAQSFVGDKLSILDIKAEDNDGKLFNIEIQISDQEDYDKRALYYWAKLYSDQMKAGKGYQELKKTIGIHVLNFLSIPEKKGYHSVFSIRDLETNQQKFHDFELHTLELIKFDEKTPDDLKSVVSRIGHKLDLWVAFLTKYNVLHKQLLPLKMEHKAVDKALSILAHMSLTDTERERYEAGEKWFWDEEAALHKARKEGVEEGLERGKKEGIEKVALTMLKKGHDLTSVAELTELSVEDIKKLQQDKKED